MDMNRTDSDTTRTGLGNGLGIDAGIAWSPSPRVAPAVCAGRLAG